MDYPLDPGALSARVKAGIPPRTVLWLGELRQYVDADGGVAVLGRLADLIQSQDCLVITTIWPEQWAAYITAARAGARDAGPAGTAGRLLKPLPELADHEPAAIDPARGGVIDVPYQFTSADLKAAADSGDSLLAAAAAAAVDADQDGQVIQYLAGVPDLVSRYAGSGGDPYGQAIITAAIDATRFGHAIPLPATLLQEAAVGYLTEPQRTKDIVTWRDTALAWAQEELKGAVRALQPFPHAAGTGVVGYQVADYLDQYGRRTRQDQLGPASLWDALIANAATASDLTRLGIAARARGLYRHAAALWTKAASLGSADAARHLIEHLGNVIPDSVTRAAHWAAARVNLDDPLPVANLILALRKAGATEAIADLLARDPAARVSLHEPASVASLLEQLRFAGADDALALLAARAAVLVDLDQPEAVAELMTELCSAGAVDAVTVLATRASDSMIEGRPRAVVRLLGVLHRTGVIHAVAIFATGAVDRVSLDDPKAVADLLMVLRGEGLSDAITVLLARDPVGHVSLDDPEAVAYLLWALQVVGASDAVAALASRAAGGVPLNNPGTVADLLRALFEAGASDAIAALLARDPGGHANLDDLEALADTLDLLREAGAADAVSAIATRAADRVPSDAPEAVAHLLIALLEAGVADAVTGLLARDPAAYASLDDPGAVAHLLRALLEAGACNAAAALASRAADGVPLHNPGTVADLLRALLEAGTSDAVTALLARDPAGQASLDAPDAIAGLLRALLEAGASSAAAALASRAADGVSLSDPRAISYLAEVLCDAAADAPCALAIRAANAAMFNLFLKVCADQASSYVYGREPDQDPSQPWEWQEPTGQGSGHA